MLTHAHNDIIESEKETYLGPTLAGCDRSICVDQCRQMFKC